MHLKLMVITLAVLFIGVNSVPLIEHVKSLNCSDPPCWPDVSGIMGDNNWYISDVNITFNCSTQVNYRIDGSNWTEYTTKFIIHGDAVHLLEWYCDNNMSQIYSIEIKIDRTPPSDSLIVKRVGFFKWQLIANVSDDTSGINRVEFFVDSRLIRNVTEPPYIAFWSGFWFIIWLKIRRTGDTTYLPCIFPYDNAGNTPPRPNLIC